MKDKLFSALENSRKYTLAVAEAMPEEAYDSRPIDSGWTFRELLCHIAYGIQWWESNYIKGETTEWNPISPKSTKRQVIDYVNQSYDSLKNTIADLTFDSDLSNGFHATLDHITHHRGQAVLHLRHQGIIPPEYVY